MDRVKGRKKGYNTATQGTSNVDTTTTRNTMQQGPSTANIDVAKGSTSNKKGKSKK